MPALLPRSYLLYLSFLFVGPVVGLSPPLSANCMSCSALCAVAMTTLCIEHRPSLCMYVLSEFHAEPL